MSRFELAVFDWNGTLTRMDAEKKLSYGAVQEIFRKYGLEAPPAEEYFAVITSNYMEDFYWPRGIPKTATRADLNAIRTRYVLERWDAQELMKPDAYDTVLKCRLALDLKCAIVSGEYCPLLVKGTFQAGLLPYLNYVRADATPKDVELANACKTLGIQPDKAFYVDDSVEGIQAAKKVGMFAIGILGGYAPDERINYANPDMVAPNLTVLQGFLETTV